MRPRTFVPDPSQARVLDHRRGAMVVDGGPGAGKTAVLRERFARLIEDGVDPDRIVMFALSRRAARDMGLRLMHRLGRSVSELPVLTIHGFAWRTVIASRYGELEYDEPPQVLSAPEQYAEVRGMLAGERREDWPHAGHLLGVRAFARQIADFVLRCQERLLSPDTVRELAESSGGPVHREAAGFYGRYLEALAPAGLIDFAGLLYQAVILLEQGIPVSDRIDHVLVDDYQDITHAGEAVVRSLGSRADSVVIAADHAGHVFSYRGGSIEPLRRVGELLPNVERVELSESHRLGPRAEALKALAKADAAPWQGSDPGIRAEVYAHPGEEVEAVAHELVSWRVDRDVPWSDLAVIVRRHGPYLTALRHALSRHDIPCFVVAEASELTTEPAVRSVIDLFRYVFRPARRDELLEPLLGSPVGGFDPTAIRRLRREARTLGLSLSELIEGAELPSVPPDLRVLVGRFRSLVRDIPQLSEDRSPDGLFFEVWRRLPFAAELVADEDPSRQRQVDSLAELSRAMARFSERRPDAGILDYVDTLEAAHFGPDPWSAAEDRHPEAVRIISAHGAQGLEFEVALVAGCLEGEFPSLSRGDPLVSLDPLVSPRTPAEQLGERLAEERALFRLAVSRARTATVLFASASTGAGTPRTPSRFVSRLGLAWARPETHAPPSASLRTMEAGLRRRLADPSQGPGERLAAAAALPAVGADPSTWWERRDWTDPGVPLYAGDDIRTSYSRLSTMENCALQYLYQVELGLDPEETHQMWVGSQVHRIIDLTQRGEIPRNIEAMHEALMSSWRPDVFPNRAVEHRRLQDAKDMLVRWFHHEQARPDASEVWFEFPLDGTIIRGRIDAVFRMENGHLRVVDYKTSRYPISRPAVKENLQLAAYYLAMKRAPELQELGGEPGYLQLAYLGKADQQTGFSRREVSPRAIPGYEQWAEDRILELLSRIKGEDFTPNPEADCQWCRFKTICPRWPEGAEVLPPMDGPVPAAGGDVG